MDSYYQFLDLNQTPTQPDHPILFQALVPSIQSPTTYEFLTQGLTFTGFPYTLELDFFIYRDKTKLEKIKSVILRRIDLSSNQAFTVTVPDNRLGVRLRLVGGTNPTVSGKIVYKVSP